MKKDNTSPHKHTEMDARVPVLHNVLPLLLANVFKMIKVKNVCCPSIYYIPNIILGRQNHLAQYMTDIFHPIFAYNAVLWDRMEHGRFDQYFS